MFKISKHTEKNKILKNKIIQILIYIYIYTHIDQGNSVSMAFREKCWYLYLPNTYISKLITQKCVALE